jgi:hypothetical protein
MLSFENCGLRIADCGLMVRQMNLICLIEARVRVKLTWAARSGDRPQQGTLMTQIYLISLIQSGASGLSGQSAFYFNLHPR